MRLSRLAACLTCPALVCLAAPEALACAAPPADLNGFSGSAPADGATDVARDAGIVLLGEVVLAAGYDFPGDFSTETFELLDAAGQPVAGASVPWITASGERELAWAPSVPLDAGATYSLHATLYRGGAPLDLTEAELALGRTLDAAFTTGTATTAPLVAGPLGLRVGEVEVEVQDCPVVGDCGLSCVVVATLTVPELVVTLPDVAGGNDLTGYSAYVAVGADTPLEFTGLEAPTALAPARMVSMTSAALPAAGTTEVTMVLRDEGAAPYRPCVSAIVWDPSGKSVVLEPVCATETVAPPPIHVGGTGGGGGAGGTGGSADSAGAGGTGTGGESVTAGTGAVTATKGGAAGATASTVGGSAGQPPSTRGDDSTRADGETRDGGGCAITATRPAHTALLVAGLGAVLALARWRRRSPA